MQDPVGGRVTTDGASSQEMESRSILSRRGGISVLMFLYVKEIWGSTSEYLVGHRIGRSSLSSERLRFVLRRVVERIGTVGVIEEWGRVLTSDVFRNDRHERSSPIFLANDTSFSYVRRAGWRLGY